METFQYARRRKHKTYENPFKHRYVLDKGVYVSTTLLPDTILEYIQMYHPDRVAEYTTYTNKYVTSRSLEDQLSGSFTWAATPSGRNVWCSIYNELCELLGKEDRKRRLI